MRGGVEMRRQIRQKQQKAAKPHCAAAAKPHCACRTSAGSPRDSATSFLASAWACWLFAMSSPSLRLFIYEQERESDGNYAKRSSSRPAPSTRSTALLRRGAVHSPLPLAPGRACQVVGTGLESL